MMLGQALLTLTLTKIDVLGVLLFWVHNHGNGLEFAVALQVSYCLGGMSSWLA